jgi:hypothetical protein
MWVGFDWQHGLSCSQKMEHLGAFEFGCGRDDVAQILPQGHVGVVGQIYGGSFQRDEVDHFGGFAFMLGCEIFKKN